MTTWLIAEEAGAFPLDPEQQAKRAELAANVKRLERGLQVGGHTYLEEFLNACTDLENHDQDHPPVACGWCHEPRSDADATAIVDGAMASHAICDDCHVKIEAEEVA